jgi:chemotaxis protein MotB
MRGVIVGIALVTLAAVAAGCCDNDRIAYNRDVNALKGQIGELEGAKTTLLGEKDRLTNELTALGKEKGVLSADLKKALDRVEELKLMAEKRKAKLKELKTKLADMQAQGKLTVVTSKGRMIVKLPENVLFDVGKAKLKKEGEAAVAQLAPILTSLEGRQFQVAGHTDSTGKDETNWKLSTDRALEVTLFLVNNGMPAERLGAIGYGRFQPVAANDTDEGRAQNRRIEIVLQPNIEELMGFEDE